MFLSRNLIHLNSSAFQDSNAKRKGEEALMPLRKKPLGFVSMLWGEEGVRKTGDIIAVIWYFYVVFVYLHRDMFSLWSSYSVSASRYHHHCCRHYHYYYICYSGLPCHISIWHSSSPSFSPTHSSFCCGIPHLSGWWHTALSPELHAKCCRPADFLSARGLPVPLWDLLQEIQGWAVFPTTPASCLLADWAAWSHNMPSAWRDINRAIGGLVCYGRLNRMEK